MRLTPEEWAIAREICTPKQLEALDLWRRGAGYKRIATLLGVDPTSARARVAAGLRRVVDWLEQDRVPWP